MNHCVTMLRTCPRIHFLPLQLATSDLRPQPNIHLMNALCILNFRTIDVIHCNGRIYKCSRRFCHMVEQAELPLWIKSPENASLPQTHSNDDFILPGTMECKEIWISNSHTSNVFSDFSDHVDKADHVDKISRILNSNHYDSSEDVVQALNGCGLGLSDGAMVGKLLKRFCNDWVPAFGFFRWADEKAGFNLSVEEYNLMVDILGKATQFDIMWILVQELVQRGNIVSLNTVGKIMRRLARAGRYSDAIGTFTRIEHLGLCKNTSSLNLLLDALCKELSVENAYDVFLFFKAKIPPDAHTFNILIHGWCKAKKFEEAHATMEEMRFHGFQPCIISYTALIEAYCDDRNFHKVDSILIEMHGRHCPPNIVTYTIIMHALGKAKQTEEVLCVLQMIKEDGCTPDTSFYNSLIYILGKAGRLQDVREIFNEMCEKGIPPDVTTYNTMISCACDYSQEEQAILLLRKMTKNLCKPDIKTYAPLLKLCCKKQKMETLRFLLKDMLERDISLDRGAYILLTNSLCRSGTLQQACLFFEQMVLKGFLPSHSTYNLLEKKLERKNMKVEKRRIQELISSLKAQILLY